MAFTGCRLLRCEILGWSLPDNRLLTCLSFGDTSLFLFRVESASETIHTRLLTCLSVGDTSLFLFRVESASETMYSFINLKTTRYSNLYLLYLLVSNSKTNHTRGLDFEMLLTSLQILHSGN